MLHGRRNVRALLALALFVLGALVDGSPVRAAAVARVTVVGDSLTVGTAGLEAALESSGWNDAKVDAKVGRRIGTTVDPTMSGVLTVRALRDQGWDTGDWVVALGTNDFGSFTTTAATAAVVQKIVDEIGPGHRIAFVTLALPTYSAQAERFNTLVRSWATAKPDRFLVVNWDQLALAHPEWFAVDQIHLNSTGYARRSSTIVSALASWKASSGGGTDVGATTPVPVPVDRPAGGLSVVGNDRVIDTRVAQGLPSRLAANTSVTVRLAELTAVPPGAVAVVANLTTVNSRAAGYLSAGPCSNIGSTSVQNFGRDDVVASLAVINLDAVGSFCALSSATTDLLVDIAGWLGANGDPITASTPSRIYDSRSGRAATHHVITVPGADAATGAIVNITVADPSGAGYVSAAACGHQVSGSNVNFSAHETTSNLAIVALDSDQLCIDASVATDVVVDLVGAAVPGADTALTTTAATRVLDTRNGVGAPAGRTTAKQTVTVNATLPSGTTAAFVQTTATGTSVDGYLTAHDCSNGVPSTSNVNTSTSVDRSNLALVAIDGGDLCVTSSARTHVVADVVAVVRSV